MEGYDAIVLTALDEVAWLFNLRGRDIPYNPVFRGYAIIEREGQIIIYLPPEKQTQLVKAHLKSEVNKITENKKFVYPTMS